MPRQNRAVSVTKGAGSAAKAPKPSDPQQARLLFVDSDDRVRTQVGRFLQGVPVRIVRAKSIAEASQQVDRTPVDVVLVNDALPDGRALELVEKLTADKAETVVIVMSVAPTIQQAMEFIRAGAQDVLIKPLNADDVVGSVDRALKERSRSNRLQTRVKRLRRFCRQVYAAREEVVQQVDALCNDLVSAYQDLANQMQQVVQTSEYSCLAGQELDLEKLIRRTLEFLLEKAGPTNMALFLPSQADEYTLGGYVNYDCTTEANELLMQQLADLAAPRIADRDGPLHLTDGETLSNWMGDDYDLMPNRHVLAFPCSNDGDTLAIVVMYRDQTQPFGASLVETCATIGPMIGGFLGKVLRIHHRHLPSWDGIDEEYWP